MLWLPPDLRLEVLQGSSPLQGRNRAGKMQWQTDFCSGCLDQLPFLHFLCQESSAELTLPPWHYYKQRPGLQPSASQNQSLWLCFSFFPVFRAEEAANWDTDWGIRNLHFWMSLFQKAGLLLCNLCNLSHLTRAINVLLKSLQPQAVPSDHDRNMS